MEEPPNNIRYLPWAKPDTDVISQIARTPDFDDGIDRSDPLIEDEQLVMADLDQYKTLDERKAFISHYQRKLAPQRLDWFTVGISDVIGVAAEEADDADYAGWEQAAKVVRDEFINREFAQIIDGHELLDDHIDASIAGN